MGRRVIGRLLAGGAFTLLGAGTVGIGAAPAVAEDEVDQVTVTGVDLAEPLEIRTEERPEVAAALHQEVGWLVGRDGDAPEPDPETLGPQYTLVVHVDGEERYRFHLYPLAEGGPRVFRPAEQPGDRSADEAWFYGRLSLPESLSAAGAPLTGDPVPAGGGSGGGEPAPGETEAPERDLLGFVDEWREGMLLTAAVAVALVAGLGGVAFLLRRAV